MKPLTLIFLFYINSCMGQYPLQKAYRTTDSTKIYYYRYVYYKDKLDAAIKKQNDNPYQIYDKKIFMYEDSCRRYKELLERLK